MKKIFTLVFMVACLGAFAQPYNNEWINFTQTYYKFKVGQNGLYRIPQTTLAAAGLGGVPAQNFQLFRNGKEVPIYTSVPSGPLGSSDYIEFWGWMNDGSPDTRLYRNPAYQHTTHWSLETDTAVFFLTVNPSGGTFHYTNTVNDTTGTPLTVEPYFNYKAATYFKSQINPGFAQIVGEYVYSSSYDIGEWWASNFIVPGGPITDVQNNLYVYNGGPAASIEFGVTGAADNVRDMQVQVNNTTVADTTLVSFNDWKTTEPLPLSLLTSNTANVSFIDNDSVVTDRTVASFYEINYPRQFNFGGQPNFYFELAAKSAGYFLKINNFGLVPSATPVLYDITNGLRYSAIIGPGNTLSFLLAGSTSLRRLVLVNEDPSTVMPVTSLAAKNFINFANTANQGNYLIISSPVLYTGSSGNNPVLDYKNYRASIAGGGFNVQVIDIAELIDQFAFGIKIHPLSIQNFLRYARATFATPPKDVLLIGHSMVYSDYNTYSEINHDPMANELDIVPTFGYPASDNKLSANSGAGDVAITPIGRLSVISGTEIEPYLAKVKEYESAQANNPNTVEGRLWMRNVMHVTGVSEPFLGQIICDYMYAYQTIIADTLCGASVTTYCDGNATQVSQIPAAAISSLFSTGLSMMNYFGHSANKSLGYNLDDPNDYNNQGKYPVFYINGCDAGDFFIFDPTRFSGSLTLSELYVLAKERGSIAFVASTHFGIVNYLNIYLNNLYLLMSGPDYGKTVGQIEIDALQAMINGVAPGDYFARLHAEEMTTHGDPALHLNQELLPDYDVETSTVQVNPNFISVSDNTFTVKAAFYNLGKAVNDSIYLVVQRRYPDGSLTTLYKQKVAGILYADSIQLTIPIVATRDKGQNYIIATVNPDTTIAEVTRINNSATVGFYVYQNEATPAYPYNYSIINTSTSKLVASTANPFAPVEQYVMQLDTTQLFNSSAKVQKFLTSPGGELEFDPGITYQDSVVYYWQVSAVPQTGGQYTWNGSSFIYIDSLHSSTGSAQSHYFQHLGSSSPGDSVQLTGDRNWNFGLGTHNFYMVNSMFGYSGFFSSDFSVTVDGNENIQSACVGHSLAFNVFNPITLTPWINVDQYGNNLYLSGSGPANCGPNQYWNFEFSYETSASRYQMMRFMDSIPNGYIVAIRSFDFDVPNSYTTTWEGDTSLFGSGKSLYHYLKNAGFIQIDSINQPRDWLMLYQKGGPMPTYTKFSEALEKIIMSVNLSIPYFRGSVISPKFGPAKVWKQVHWRGTHAYSPATDTASVQVIGIDTSGNSTVLYNMGLNTQDLDISAVSASKYPYMELMENTLDSVHAKPYQLKYWRINYTPVPEGAIAPNILLKSKDTLGLGQPFEFAIPFKNISPYNFDSLKIQMYIIDHNNVTHLITLPRRKPLISGDTVLLDYIIDTKNYPGANTLYIDFNPNNDQPEQYLFNNFMYKNFYVQTDSRNPLLDVTFDNVHILNNDIVSAKPHIQIKLKSLSSYLLLADTSLITVQLMYPDGSLHNYSFNSDSLRFTPATSGSNNVATVDFTPSFTTQYNPQGDIYQLIVTGKDPNGNTAGTVPYRISFQVITKAMISNMLNYPNPFTTSTAFVFTITGSEVPQNIKIQILTVTGKIIREITKDELGPLHVGRNITEFKWNGTDQYGQRLANGVYLYHVVTNLNGKSLDKYTAAGDNTSQYFNNGYGKMYLMK